MIWAAFAAMLFAAVLVVAVPIWRRSPRPTPWLGGAVAVVVAVTVAVYWRVGTPVLPDAAPSVADMVASLDRRLEENPEDLEGWRMLARSYLHLQDFPKAVAAYERVVDMESAQNPESLAGLGEALLASGPGQAARAAGYFDSALALQPANPQALFFSGIAAVELGDPGKAADRWEALLALSPPPEIESILRPRVAEWRAAADAPEPAAAGSAPGPTLRSTPGTSGTSGSPPESGIVAVNVSLGKSAAGSVAPDATVYVIARDPVQPSPPIAAARRRVSELPAQVRLTDADAMMPGRLLSSFEQLEIVARVSTSGDPIARPGDWYGQHTVSAPASEPVDIVIERQLTADGGRKQ